MYDLRHVPQAGHRLSGPVGSRSAAVRAGSVGWLQARAGNRAVAAMLAPLGRSGTSTARVVQRKGGGGGGSATGVVGIPGGESATPSDRSGVAPSYTLRADGNFDTPDGRVVTEAQAKDESAVVESKGIYMAAYLARYDKVKTTYALSAAELATLSESAGFLEQFDTGDVVLRQMDASDSEALARLTNSQYSHTGIVQRKGKRVMVLDSYPEPAGTDASIMRSFEEFFSDHAGDKIVNALVIRSKTINAAVKADIDKLIDKYAVEVTSFDFDFRADNGADVLYCSELVTRVLTEAGSRDLPPNEFAATRANAMTLAAGLQLAIDFQKATGTDSTAAEAQLATLTDLIAKVDAATVKDLFSPGSFERSGDFETLAGFTRGGEIEGSFTLTVLDATVPDQTWETPDPFVELGGDLDGRTAVKDDTTSPSWSETFGDFRYEDLAKAKFTVVDEDVISDDVLATIDADVRPVAPAGQTFTLQDAGVTLRVRTQATDADSVAAQAPRERAALP